MPPIYASIDLETTGLNADQDAIIEIGIVLFQGDDIVDQWSSLVNPRRRVPPNITDLTGITQADVDGAPSLLQIRPKVGRMVSGRTLVAHNAPFDLAFLRRNGLCEENGALDTLELASILFPTAGRYSRPDRSPWGRRSPLQARVLETLVKQGVGTWKKCGK